MGKGHFWKGWEDEQTVPQEGNGRESQVFQKVEVFWVWQAGDGG